jgi:hypothetical protein
MRRMKYLPTMLLIAACGGGGGGGAAVDGPEQIDAKVFHDAPPSVPEMITISGTASASGLSGSTPLAGVTIGFYKKTDASTAVGTATSGADGTYSMTVATNGVVLDGYIKANISGYADNYLYSTAPLFADYSADANMVSSGDFAGLGFITGQDPNLGFVAAVILDASDALVTGAAIASTPASKQYMYADDNGTPKNGTGTNANGQAYFISMPAGDVEITATKAGITFHPHIVQGHPGALTTTTITP